MKFFSGDSRNPLKNQCEIQAWSGRMYHGLYMTPFYAELNDIISVCGCIRVTHEIPTLFNSLFVGIQIVIQKRSDFKANMDARFFTYEQWLTGYNLNVSPSRRIRPYDKNGTPWGDPERGQTIEGGDHHAAFHFSYFDQLVFRESPLCVAAYLDVGYDGPEPQPVGMLNIDRGSKMNVTVLEQ